MSAPTLLPDLLVFSLVDQSQSGDEDWAAIFSVAAPDVVDFVDPMLDHRDTCGDGKLDAIFSLASPVVDGGDENIVEEIFNLQDTLDDPPAFPPVDLFDGPRPPPMPGEHNLVSTLVVEDVDDDNSSTSSGSCSIDYDDISAPPGSLLYKCHQAPLLLRM